MDNIEIVFLQILKLLIMILIGFILAKKNIFTKTTGEAMVKILFKVTLPALILAVMIGYDFTKEKLLNGFSMMLLSAIFIIIAYFLSVFSSKLLKLENDSIPVFKFSSTFGNVGFLALPLAQALFGEIGLVYSVFFMIVNDTGIWTLGIYTYSKNKQNSLKNIMKVFINPVTIVFLIGLIYLVFGIRNILIANSFLNSSYLFIFDVLNMIGKATIPLSMLFIGISITNVNLNKNELKNDIGKIIILIGTKMIFYPILIILLFSIIEYKFDKNIITILVLMLCISVPALTPAFAYEYKKNHMFATKIFISTTIFNLIAIPLNLFLINILIK